MKRAFTLLEVVISITIFMILLLFLYKVLDQTKLSNTQFKTKEIDIKSTNQLSNIFLEDILEKTTKITFKIDNDKNTQITFKTSNTYHNPFYSYVTYLISSNDKLIRMESKDKFLFQDTPIEFYDNAFIDILLEDIEYFEVVSNDTNYTIVIKQKNRDRLIFSAYEFL
ncbi:prepilin-type N-terminal cleavage/methylation domain-containing protein [Arcobacter peruensis]|uniref:prepilin-type N-terminal cleavage/methylation domain-containing protein n=1 Tax=Arcobacter peruensis TaxID=2320140 RepID=UPI000F08A4D9|nr:prepilin-type N-terminal cleavage/methylation domain-containing protein [Arcobacter peruensis]